LFLYYGTYIEMKKIINTLIATFMLLCGTAYAKDYTLIILATPGSTPDFVARTIQTKYNELTGNNLIIDYAPGADGIIAVRKFKESKKGLLLVSSTVAVLNPFLKENLEYTVQDFDWVGLVAWHPQVWYANADSGITDLASLKKYVKNNPRVAVGGDSVFNFVNATALFSAWGVEDKADYIRYKGSPEALTGTIAGSHPLGITAPGPTVIGAHQAGKVKIFAISERQPVKMGDFVVPPVDATGNIYTLSGFSAVAANTAWPDQAELKKLKQDLWAAIRHPDTQEKLVKNGLVSNPVPGDKMPALVKKQQEDFSKHAPAIKKQIAR
jgi:tripartite-type tricarboxylate transporter receptor subunit TctC